MRVILTHEQADFDALAALLGTSLLQDGDFPILPRKMNRNVRAFTSLYGQELELIDIRDLPSEDIEQVTLVDTQSLITLKGMTSRTKIRVIDHHLQKESIDPDWELRIERIGAVTTLLV
jgi:tRNA nucleotidyltransferase (CCA-adding enzyme)